MRTTETIYLLTQDPTDRVEKKVSTSRNDCVEI